MNRKAIYHLQKARDLINQVTSQSGVSLEQGMTLAQALENIRAAIFVLMDNSASLHDRAIPVQTADPLIHRPSPAITQVYYGKHDPVNDITDLTKEQQSWLFRMGNKEAGNDPTDEG